jgi:hypothetical protein
MKFKRGVGEKNLRGEPQGERRRDSNRIGEILATDCTL